MLYHLGRSVDYPSGYDPSLLQTVERSCVSGVELYGFDVWNLYELYWLDESGKPVAGIGRFWYTSRSELIVESKSVKLYLMSMNEHKFSSGHDVAALIELDIARVLKTNVYVDVVPVNGLLLDRAADVSIGSCIDDEDMFLSSQDPGAHSIISDQKVIVRETLHTNILKSNCPVTSQPDYGSLILEYYGPKINKSSLFSYIASIRNNECFHETCVEMICEKIILDCGVEEITVTGMYNRRGGVDINPIRSNKNISAYNLSRALRQ